MTSHFAFLNLISCVSLVKLFFLLIIICGVGMMDYVWFSSVWESLSCWHQSRFLLWGDLLSLTIQNLCGVLSYTVALGMKSDACSGSILNSSVLFFKRTVFFSWELLLLLNFPRSSNKKRRDYLGLNSNQRILYNYPSLFTATSSLSLNSTFKQSVIIHITGFSSLENLISNISIHKHKCTRTVWFFVKIQAWVR